MTNELKLNYAERQGWRSRDDGRSAQEASAADESEPRWAPLDCELFALIVSRSLTKQSLNQYISKVDDTNIDTTTINTATTNSSMIVVAVWWRVNVVGRINEVNQRRPG